MSVANWGTVEAAKSKAEALPVGDYTALFLPVEYLAAVKGCDGPRLRWSWHISDGPRSGQKATALTSVDIRPPGLAYVLAAGMLGREPAAGENVKALLDASIGSPCRVSILPGSQGGKPAVRRVERLKP